MQLCVLATLSCSFNRSDLECVLSHSTGMPMIPTFPKCLHTYNDRMFHALAELNGRARAVGDGSPTDGDEMTDLPTLTTDKGHRCPHS